MINTNDLYKKVNDNLNGENINYDSESLKKLNHLIKDYTIEKLLELNCSFDEIERHNTLNGLLHLLNDSLKNENKKNIIFNNYIFTILNCLGNVQESGILWQKHDGYVYQGNPSLELNNNGDIFMIKTDDSCSSVNNTIYIYRLLNRAIANKVQKQKTLIRK